MAKTEDRVEFLAACKATDSRNKALEEIRDKGAEVILATFRLLKNSLVHALGNKAVQTTVKETHGIISDFASVVGGYVSITYVEDTIFVCGQLLRASRSIYESAMEVGKMLAICGRVGGELHRRDHGGGPARVLRSVRGLPCANPSSAQPHARGQAQQRHRAQGRLVAAEQTRPTRTCRRWKRRYARTRRHWSCCGSSTNACRRARPCCRTASNASRSAWVSMAETDEGALLAMTTLANAHRDDAGRAVQCGDPVDPRWRAS